MFYIDFSLESFGAKLLLMLFDNIFALDDVILIFAPVVAF